jgi:hypothetical protein
VYQNKIRKRPTNAVFIFQPLVLQGRSPTEATRLRFDHEKITLQSPTDRTFSSWWRFSHQRDHDAMTTRHEFSVVDFFLDRIAVASPQWETDLKVYDNGRLFTRLLCWTLSIVWGIQYSSDNGQCRSYHSYSSGSSRFVGASAAVAICAYHSYNPSCCLNAILIWFSAVLMDSNSWCSYVDLEPICH